MGSARSAQRGSRREAPKAPGAWHARRGAGLAVAVLVSTACLLALALALAGARTVGATLRGSGSSTDSPVDLAATAGPAADRFRIAGMVAGLYPGDTAKLMLTVSNPLHVELVVTSISTVVADANAGCGAAYLTVAAWTGALAVPGRASAQVTVPVTLAHAAPDACQGAVFPLRYSGLAGRA